ncbi:hypothetical protein ABE10_01945, partial [Bacillus toyonensis]|nr:hypothetical protein [Bacillus toyonensis]
PSGVVLDARGAAGQLLIEGDGGPLRRLRRHGVDGAEKMRPRGEAGHRSRGCGDANGGAGQVLPVDDLDLGRRRRCGELPRHGSPIADQGAFGPAQSDDAGRHGRLAAEEGEDVVQNLLLGDDAVVVRRGPAVHGRVVSDEEVPGAGKVGGRAGDHLVLPDAVGHRALRLVGEGCRGVELVQEGRAGLHVPHGRGAPQARAEHRRRGAVVRGAQGDQLAEVEALPVRGEHLPDHESAHGVADEVDLCLGELVVDEVLPESLCAGGDGVVRGVVVVVRVDRPAVLLLAEVVRDRLHVVGAAHPTVDEDDRPVRLLRRR